MPSPHPRRPRPHAEPADVLPVLVASGWTPRREPGAPGGVVASDATGAVCEVARVEVPAEPGARAALVEHLDALSQDHEHLAGVRGVLQAGESSLVVLVDHVDGLPLDELAGAREPFRAAEAVTVLVPVAQGLAALHRDARVHGGLDAACVRVTPGGRAVLRPPLAPATGTSADDVRDLARLVLGLVPPPASSHPSYAGPEDPAEARDLAALHAELAAALRDDPEARPAAGTFAARCYDAVEPRPVTMPEAARLVAGALGARRDPGARRAEAAAPATRRARRVARPARPGRRARTGRRVAATAPAPGRRATAPRPSTARAVGTSVAIVVGAAVLVAVLAVLGPGRATPGAADAETPTAVAGLSHDGATRDPADPLGAARVLTERRLALLADGTGDLASIVVAGSPAHEQDEALLAELAGVDVLDARAEVFDARPAGSWSPPAADADGDPADATVEVDYAVGAHRQRTPDGEIQVPATPRTTVVLVLRWTDDGWRVVEVR